MKKVLLLLYVVSSALLLGGCQGDLFSSRRDMERLRPVQTLGADRDGDGVMLSVCTGTGPDDAPSLVMRAGASGIENAIDRLQSLSPEDELFYAHVRYILLGEDMAAQGVMPMLDWVERSPAMRMDTALFVVRGRADEAVTGASGETSDVTERLSSLERELQSRGRHIYTLRELAASLLDRGAALCLAVEPRDTEGAVFSKAEADTEAIVPAGYAVLRDGLPVQWLTEEESLGAELLTCGVSGAHATVDGNALDLIRGRADVTGQWDGGVLTGILVKCELRAGILEREQGGQEDIELLRQALTDAAGAWIEAVIRRSQTLGCDFLDLERGAMKDAPGDADLRWDAVFPDLPVTVLTDARIDRSYDLSYEVNEP